MKEKYWFRARKYGYGWSPSTWQGYLVVILYLGGNIYYLLDSLPGAQSEVDIFFRFVPKVLIFSAMLIIITYLKGEPVAWQWGKEEKNKNS